MGRQKLTDAQRRWLQVEIDDWRKDDLVTHDQAIRILERYETTEEGHQRSQSLIVFALFGMAALLFAAAVLLVIGFNWEAMPRGLKLTVILAVVAGVHGLGFYLRRAWNAVRLSEVVFFLGCLLYGAGIWLVAQVFHIDAHFPDGFWWWALGVLPFALCLDSLLLHLLFVALMATWAGTEVLGFMHLTPWGFFSWRIPNGAYSLLPLALPGLLWGYRKGSAVTVGLYVALLAWWVVLLAFAFGMFGRSVFWIGSVGAVLLILAEIHRQGNRMAIPYRLWGTLLTAGVLLPLSSSEFWRYGLGTDFYGYGPSIGAAVGEVAAILGLVGAAVGVLLAISRRHPEHGRAALRRQLFPATWAVALAGMALWSLLLWGMPLAWVLPVIVANAAMLGLSIYLIRVGAREERVPPFAAGVIYFLLWTIVRYVDLFQGAGGMLAAALLFALCGAGLVVVGIFWGRVRSARQSGLLAFEPAEPFVGPPWLDGAWKWVVARSGQILAVTAALQVVLLVGMIVVEAVPLFVGETVQLHVTPVDPRDLFRGDYVILNYDLNRAQPDGVLPGAWERLDQPVYVTLEPDEDGKHWRAGRASWERPASGKFIRGRVAGDYRQPIQYGIEAFYVQEGQGKEWERIRNARKLSAEIALTPWGKAKLRRLVVDED